MKSINYEVKNCERLMIMKIDDGSFVDMMKVTFESELFQK